MAKDKITSVKAGEEITVKYPAHGKVKVTVSEACTNQNNGQWYCVTCGEFFQNQLQKDFHISEHKTKSHVLAWNCYQHGIEQP